MKGWIIGILIILIFVGVVYAYNNPQLLTNIQKIQIGTPSDSIEEINNNFATYENKSVKVSGKLFGIIPEKDIYESLNAIYNTSALFPHPIATIKYQLTDSQGYYLYLSATNRDLTDYIGKTLTIQGIIKFGYDGFLTPQYYIELSKIY